MSKKIKVLQSTYFKLDTIQSSDLADNQKVMVETGKEFDVHSDAPAPNNHVKIALANASLGAEGRNTWFVFAPHVEIDGNEPDNQPKDEPDPQTVKIGPTKTGPFKLPGFESTFYLSEPIIAGGHFSWAEATKNGTRLPVDKNVVDNIIKVAHVMEEVREFVGSKTITVNSWYRDPVSNKKAGGASQSRHMVGDAVDFVVAGIAPPQVNKMLDSWWGSRGGLASASCFTHIDVRGYRARWSYGF